MQKIGFWLGTCLCIILIVIPAPNGLTPEAQKMAAVTLLMVVWWVTEAIPMYVTALLPIALFPLLNILPSTETAINYGNNYVLMLIGAFILAKGIEKQHLHKRIALSTINLLGTGQRKIILGFMITTAFLSMWITNMAVVLMMLPIMTAILAKNDSDKFGTALLLAVAYAASVGGTGTLIGTPPNLVFAGLIEKLYPESPGIGFMQWMQIALPLVLITIPIIYWYIIYFYGIKKHDVVSTASVLEELKAMGKTSVGEQRIIVIFSITILGWIFREDWVFDSFTLPGWGTLLGVSSYVHDSTVAIGGAIALFMVNDGKGQKLMTWKTATKIPWGVALFLGGGLALGMGFRETGLAQWIGDNLNVLGHASPFWTIATVVSLIIFITEVNSNTATATIFLPIIAAMAIAEDLNPLVVMIPATFACSLAFMLPSGTGTNTVIFASEQIKVSAMAKTGFWLNLICIVLLTCLLYGIIFPLLGITSEVPQWAR